VIAAYLRALPAWGHSFSGKIRMIAAMEVAF
jgi:hypothetical protein